MSSLWWRACLQQRPGQALCCQMKVCEWEAYFPCTWPALPRTVLSDRPGEEDKHNSNQGGWGGDWSTNTEAQLIKNGTPRRSRMQYFYLNRWTWTVEKHTFFLALWCWWKDFCNCIVLSSFHARQVYRILGRSPFHGIDRPVESEWFCYWFLLSNLFVFLLLLWSWGADEWCVEMREHWRDWCLEGLCYSVNDRELLESIKIE